MTDMRNFNTTPSNDIHAHAVLVDSDNAMIKDSYTLDESGEGLGQFHTNSDMFESGNGRGKVIGALVVALMLGMAGAYVYSTMPTQHQNVVANKDLPRPAGPGLAVMMPDTPAPAMEAAPTADATPGATTEGMTPSDTAATTTQSVAPVTAAVTTPAPAPMQRQAAAPVVTTPATAPAVVAPLAPVAPPVMQLPQVSTVPEPVSPTPPASAVAGIPPLNEQSLAPQPEPIAPAVPAEALPDQ